MISYDKLFQLLKDNGWTSYRIRKEGLLGSATTVALKRGKGVNTNIIERLCRTLDCQPGDLMEYIPDKGEKEE